MSATNPAKRRRFAATDPALRAATLQHANAHGVRSASEQYNIPEGTIRSWQTRGRKRGELVPTSHLKHGVYSEREISKRADLLRGELFRIAPDLEDERFATAVAEYLRAIARAQLAHNALMAGDPAQPNTRLLEQATASARLVAKLGRDLALDPGSATRLKVTAIDAEAGIKKLIQEGHDMRAAREAAVDATVEEDR